MIRQRRPAIQGSSAQSAYWDFCYTPWRSSWSSQCSSIRSWRAQAGQFGLYGKNWIVVSSKQQENLSGRCGLRGSREVRSWEYGLRCDCCARASVAAARSGNKINERSVGATHFIIGWHNCISDFKLTILQVTDVKDSCCKLACWWPRNQQCRQLQCFRYRTPDHQIRHKSLCGQESSRRKYPRECQTSTGQTSSCKKSPWH